MAVSQALGSNAAGTACMHAVKINSSFKSNGAFTFPACQGRNGSRGCTRLANCSSRLFASLIVGQQSGKERPQWNGRSVEKGLRSSLWGQELGCQCSWSTLQKDRRRGVTSAAWQDDAPYFVAIGIAIATSAAPLVVPVPWSRKAATDSATEKKRFNDFNTFGSEDTKFNVMALIAFLPLFNWLAWVLAWLDTSDARYALFAAAYLAPWVKSGLNFTEDWLPLSALALGAVHVQVERYVQSEGPVRSLPGSTEQPVEPSEEKKSLPEAKFDDRGWAATLQKEDWAKLKLSEEETRRREQKWELKRWDEQFAERLKAEVAADATLSRKADD